jgi:hypothetical protein
MEQSIKTYKPKIGDIFFGEEEFIIGRYKDDTKTIIEVGITEEDCIIVGERIETIYSKDKIIKFPCKTEIDLSCIDPSRKLATWVVEYTDYREPLHLYHSIIPESYFIRARRMINDSYDKYGEVIEFYTCGILNKNLVNKDLEIIGNLKI